MSLHAFIRRNKATTAIVLVAPLLLTAAKMTAFAMASAGGLAGRDVPLTGVDVPAAQVEPRDMQAESLAAYAHGDLDLSIELARQGGHEDLAQQLSQIEAHAQASGVARVSGDLATAIREMEDAVAADA